MKPHRTGSEYVSGTRNYIFLLLVFQVVPEGFKDLLVWLADEYSNPEMIITENGFSDTGEVDDEGRVSYYRVGRQVVVTNFLK